MTELTTPAEVLLKARELVCDRGYVFGTDVTDEQNIKINGDPTYDGPVYAIQAIDIAVWGSTAETPPDLVIMLNLFETEDDKRKAALYADTMLALFAVQDGEPATGDEFISAIDRAVERLASE